MRSEPSFAYTNTTSVVVPATHVWLHVFGEADTTPPVETASKAIAIMGWLHLDDHVAVCIHRGGSSHTNAAEARKVDDGLLSERELFDVLVRRSDELRVEHTGRGDRTFR
jgi:hypothetical protein